MQTSLTNICSRVGCTEELIRCHLSNKSVQSNFSPARFESTNQAVDMWLLVIRPWFTLACGSSHLRGMWVVKVTGWKHASHYTAVKRAGTQEFKDNRSSDLMQENKKINKCILLLLSGWFHWWASLTRVDASNLFYLYISVAILGDLLLYTHTHWCTNTICSSGICAAYSTHSTLAFLRWNDWHVHWSD